MDAKKKQQTYFFVRKVSTLPGHQGRHHEIGNKGISRPCKYMLQLKILSTVFLISLFFKPGKQYQINILLIISLKCKH